MPLYEFRCKACGERFDELARTPAAVACPRCGSEELERLYSSFATEWRPGNVNWHRLPGRW